MSSDAEFADGRILLRVTGPVARIVFNNPDRLNAMDLAMWDGLTGAAEHVSEAAEIRVVVLEGAGAKAFIAGADISEFAEVRSTAADAEEYDRRVVRADEAVSAIPVPTIAAIRGHCVGGGVGVAVRCDLRIARDDARFAVTPARLGLGYYYDGVAQLERLVGPAITAQLLFTGQAIGADEALRSGLVNGVEPADDFDAAVSDLCDTIVANAPKTIRAVKAALRDLARPPGERSREAVDRMIHACAESGDFAEGQRAFAEKRPPRFTG